MIGPHVQEGHFDLIDSNGAIMLPSLWTSLIKPGESITMHMWPMPETPCPPRPVSNFNNHFVPPPPPGWPGARPSIGPGPPPAPPASRPPGWVGLWPPGPRPAPPPHLRVGGPPRPPHMGPGFPPCPPPATNRGPPAIINVLPRGPPISIKKKSESISIYSWLAGKPAYRRRRAYWSDSSDSEDGSEILSDSDIECEAADVEMAVDFEREEGLSKLSFGELLGKMTNALDTVGGEGLDSDDSDSDSGSVTSSGSDRSLVDD